MVNFLAKLCGNDQFDVQETNLKALAGIKKRSIRNARMIGVVIICSTNALLNRGSQEQTKQQHSHTF